MCSLYSTVNIVRLAGSGPETCTRRIRLGRRLLAALDACYGKQISIPSLKFSTHSAQRCVTLNGCQTKEMEKQKKKNTVSRKKTHHPPTEPGSHPLTTPDDDSDGNGDLNCELRNGNWELRVGKWALEREGGTGGGRGVGTLQRLLSGARQRKAATIKILKIHHWKNGRKKREEHETKRNEANSVHHFRGHVVFCFCKRGRGRFLHCKHFYLIFQYS